MILVDTTVWVDHLRTNEPLLVEHLRNNNVLMHSIIIGELACGNLENRAERLRDWGALAPIPELNNGEVLKLIETRGLMGRGIGFMDCHILGAVLNKNGPLLWTRDTRLDKISDKLGIAFAE